MKDIIISRVKTSINAYSEFACSKNRQCRAHPKLSRVSLVYRKMVLILVDRLSDLISFGPTLSCCIRCRLFMLAFIASSIGVNRTRLLTAGHQKTDETLTEQTFRMLWDQICFCFTFPTAHLTPCIQSIRYKTRYYNCSMQYVEL